GARRGGSAMKLEFVRYEKRDHVAVVTINRPEVMNALHPPANEELSRVWDDVADDPDVRVAILTGAGDRAFSAGNDLKWTAQHGVPRMPKGGFGGLVARDDLWKPLIAVQASKQAALQGLGRPLAEAMAAQYPLVQRLFTSEDVVEGPRAFAEKRKPVWKGR